MRRMYSEQELSKIIKEVFDAEVEAGEFDETIADYVDAYLVEHPVDITALEGQDVELNSLDATGLITGSEIVEKMSGYSFTASSGTSDITYDFVYAGAVKNGNKVTLVLAFKFTAETGGAKDLYPGSFTIPTDVYNKIFPVTIGGVSYTDVRYATLIPTISGSSVEGTMRMFKNGPGILSTRMLVSVTENVEYYVRYEVTYLLSDNLIPQE